MPASRLMWVSSAIAVGAALLTGPNVRAVPEEPIDDRLAAALSDGGTEFAADVDWEARPEYGLWARIEPDTFALDKQTHYLQ